MFRPSADNAAPTRSHTGFRLPVRGRLALIAVVAVTGLMVATPGAGAARPATAASRTAVRAPMDTNPGTSEGNFVPLLQTTIVDTRSGLGLPQAKLAGGATSSFTVTGGTTGVPSTGVSAVVLDLMTTTTSAPTAMEVWPAGATPPGITNLVAQPGTVGSGTAYVAPGAGGKVSVTTTAGTTDLIVDVTGYFTTTDNTAGFSPVPGRRVLDTRHGIGAPHAPIPAGGNLDISLAAAGIPTSATEVVVTATVYSTGNSYLNLSPPSAPNTKATSIAVPAANSSGQPSSTTQIAQTDGQSLRLTAGPANSLDVLLDVTGYFGASQSGGGFTPLQTRVYDSRNAGSTTIPANGVLSVPLLGAGAVPADITKVGAVALNVTVDGPSTAGDIRAYADGTTEPTTIQTVTFASGETTTNGTVINTTTPATGRVILRNLSSAAVKVVIDVQGYFAPYYNPDPGTSFPGGPGAQSFSQFSEFAVTARDDLRVATASGNGLYDANDVSIAGLGLNLQVSRHYNSRVSALGAFGPGWSMDAGGDMKLTASGANEVFTGPTGFQVTFTAAASGTWTSPLGLRATLSTVSGGYRLKFKASAEVWTFTTAGQLSTRTDRNANVLRYTYNADGTLATVVDTRGRTLTATWSGGRLTQLADSTGRTWGYAYTGGLLTTYTDPANNTTTYGYDASSRLSTITNTRNTVMTMGYDGQGRVTAVTRSAGGPQYTFTYEDGRTKSTDALANTTLALVDDQGRVTKVTDALGHSQSVSYDVNSNITTFTPATMANGGVPFQNTYSATDPAQLTSSALPTGAQETFSYSGSTNAYSPSTVTSPEGNATTYTYDAAGNVSGSTDSTAGAGHATVTRNTDGTVNTSTDAKGNLSSYHYGTGSTAGQLTSITYPAPRGSVSFEYDDASRLTAYTDGNGHRRTYTYDPLNQVTKITAPGVTDVAYTYDPAGNRTQLTDASGTTTATFDPLNRVSTESLSQGGNTSYGYDANSNLTSLTDAAGTVGYAYNAVNLLSTVTDPNNATTTLGYNADNQRTSVTWPGGVRQLSDYDASDRVTRTRGITPGSASITDFHYLYTNSAGKDTALRQAVTDVNGITTGYAYDALDRLLSATLKNSSGTVKTYGYGYDKNGNRTTATVDGATTTAAFNGADQLCWTAPGSPASPACGSPAAGATTYTYDANGNQTGSTTPSGAGTATTYNSLDQATTITPTAQAPYAVTYAGPTQNQRLTYTDTAGSTTRTFTNTNSILGITARTGTNPGTTDGYTRDTTGHLLTDRTGSARTEYLTDGLGSIAAVANPDGTVDHTYAYDPYGVTTSSLTAGTFDTNPFRYTSEPQDNNTGLYQIGARTLNPTIGRWTQTDPSGKDANPYAYVGDNPINTFDPTGLYGIWNIVNDFVGGGFGLAVTGVCAVSTLGIGALGCGILGTAVGAYTVDQLNYDSGS